MIDLQFGVSFSPSWPFAGQTSFLLFPPAQLGHSPHPFHCLHFLVFTLVVIIPFLTVFRLPTVVSLISRPSYHPRFLLLTVSLFDPKPGFKAGDNSGFRLYFFK